MKQGSGLYAYLAASGVLEKGTAEEIAEAKREYWRMQKREWKKAKRREHKLYEVFFSPAECKVLAAKATPYGYSITRWIKLAALSGSDSITPEMVGMVRQLLMQAYSDIEMICEEGNVATPLTEQLLAHLARTEQRILSVLMQSTAP